MGNSKKLCDGHKKQISKKKKKKEVSKRTDQTWSVHLWSPHDAFKKHTFYTNLRSDLVHAYVAATCRFQKTQNL